MRKSNLFQLSLNFRSLQRRKAAMRFRSKDANRFLPRLIFAGVAMVLFLYGGGIAAEEKEEAKKLPKISVREIFVPDSEMATLLENCKDRVLLSREEFETLLLESLKQQSETSDKPEAAPSNPLVVLSNDLVVTVEGEQARIKAKLEWESFSDQWQTASFPLENVAVHSALLNGEPAKLGLKPHSENHSQAEYVLFLRGKGRHKLELEMITPLYLDAVRQELRFQILHAPKTSETLIIPGDVELKEGAMIVSRVVEGEGASRVTRFELLPKSPLQNIVLTLNSHRTRMVRSILARSVQFAEVTEHYEKLHATVSLDVLHQPVQSAEFIVPSGFEMTEVTSPQLLRWSVTERDKKTILEVRFREPVNGLVPIHLTAVHFFETASAADVLSEWAFPSFQPLDVNNDSAVFGLLVDTQWNVHQLNAKRLIPIAPQILNETIPDSVFDVSVDAPAVRTAAAWYAPNTENWSIVCEFLKPKPAFDAASHQVLTLSDKEETLRGLIQIAPRYEKIFELTLESPEHWTMVRVANQQDVALPFEQKGKTVRIKIINGIPAGTVFPVIFEAKGNTPGWFGSWDEQKLAFPRFCLIGAASDSGTIAVDVETDMRVTSENDVRLAPLDSKERTEFLAGLPTDMAFRYLSQPYSTDLKISRAEPRLTARTFAFFRFAPSLLSASYELHYNIEQARTKSLSFLLPPDTPENVGIQGLNGLVIKEYTSSTVTKDGKEYRKWNLQLADPVAGAPVIGVNFEQARQEKNDTKKKNDKENVMELPLLLANDAAWQSGLVSVEGHEELNLSIENNLEKNQEIRQADVGELAATQYVPGRRLIGVYEGVTAQNPLKIRIERNPDFQLPASLVQLARGEIEIAADGKRIAKAIYDLKTRAVFLKIGFYRNEEIWSVSLDGQTLKPQKDANGILVDIPAKDDAAVRELEIIWALSGDSKPARMFASSEIQLPDLLTSQNFEDETRENPNLKVQAERGTIFWQKIPVTRMAWNVTAPPGYDVIRVGNQTLSNETPRPILLRYFFGIVGYEWLAASRDIHHWGIGCSAPPQSAKNKHPLPETAMPADSSVVFLTAPAPVGETSDLKFLNAPSESEIANDSGFLDKKLVSPKKTDLSMLDGAFDLNNKNVGNKDAKSSLKSEEFMPYQKQTLQTVRPVQVTFQKNLSAPLQRHLQFQWIGGGNASMNVYMVNTRLTTFGIYLIWGAVFAVGLWLLKSSVRAKTIFVSAVIIAGTLFVLLPGLETFAKLFDETVKAALGVMALYLVRGGWQKLTQSQTTTESVTARHSAEKAAMILLLAATVLIFGNRRTWADDSQEKILTLPDGVIAVFYDEETLKKAAQNGTQFPDPNILTRNDQKLLVPYAKYQELWKLVHLEEKTVNEEKPPANYAITSGEYSATLNAADDLVVNGKAEIELLADQVVLFPMPIQHGILTSLKADGKDAEISVSLIQPLQQPRMQQQQAMQPQMAQQYSPMQAPPQQNGMFVVQIRGKGKHMLEWTTRFKVGRQGGWRSATGILPKFPAGKIRITLPEERMEFRCTEVSGQSKWIAGRAGEVIDTSLNTGGKFHWSWRSKVTEAEIDRSLTANSELQFNIQEDSLILNWDLSLAFRRGKQESFRLRIPNDYLVAEVTGENVRGWENVETDFKKDSAKESQIDVELLHPTEGNDRYRLVLMKKVDFSENKPHQIVAPNIGVVAAAMHHGRITIQHSPRFDVKIGETSNASMTDMLDQSRAPTVSDSESSSKVMQSPLGLTAFRAYSFMTENYLLSMTAGNKRRGVHYSNNNIVKLTPHEIKLESNFQFHYPVNHDVFKEVLLTSKGLKLDAVRSDSSIEWSTKPLESGETELTVLWTAIPDNRRIVFNVLGTVLRNQKNTADLPVALRKESSPDHYTTNASFAVLTDPAFDVQLSDVVDLSAIETNANWNWITPEQRPLCRKQLVKQGKKPSAKLTLVPREPKIISESITNVRMNNRSVEESILLDYNIQNAGIHSVQFELPKNMADVRIDAPLLQRKEIAETDHDTILVTLHLQDEIMNEFRVFIRNDRELISGKTYLAAIPKMLTGAVRNQYIVLENAGSRDELQIDTSDVVNVRKISRQQNEWRRLQEILGSGATEAYLVTSNMQENAAQNNPPENQQSANASKEIAPKLPFSMTRRETVKMSGAQIGLAETRVVLGENGDYLAEQIYRIDNKTEQFLDLKLPSGAKIWTVRILTSQEWNARESGQSGDFGQPVKPTLMTSGEYWSMRQKNMPENEKKLPVENSLTPQTEAARIPIVKTEVGDLDYIVRIVYAGTIGKIRRTSSLDVPFLESLNIPVAASYAKLHLPENYKFTFGGTMRQSDQNLVKQTVSDYKKRVETKLQQTLQTGNPYEQTRAKTNLLQLGFALPKGIGKPVDETQAHVPQLEKRSRETVTRRPGYEMQIVNSGSQSGETLAVEFSNSLQLQQRFESQSNVRGKNVVAQSSDNWKLEQKPQVSSSLTSSSKTSNQFDGKWLENNGFTQNGRDSAKKKSPINENDEIHEKPQESATYRRDDSLQENKPLFGGADNSRQTPQNGVEENGKSPVQGFRDSSRFSNERQQQSAVQFPLNQKLNDKELASKLSGKNPQLAEGIFQQQVPQLLQAPLPQSQINDAVADQSSSQIGRELGLQNNLISNSETSDFNSFAQSDDENIKRYEKRLAANNRASTAPQSGGRRSSLAGTDDIGASSSIGSGTVSGSIISNNPNNSRKGNVNLSVEVHADSGMTGRIEVKEYGGGYAGGSMANAAPNPNASGGPIGSPVVVPSAVACEPEISSEEEPSYSGKTSVMSAKAASLDIEIPQTGAVYFFTAPKAEHRLSIRGISHASLQRAGDLTCVVIIFAVIGLTTLAVKKSGGKKRKSPQNR
ncbi:MAG: hypothetical protein LBT05_08095 [Planctomycetaceae bacterium]|jgi:hypothetical protein|nr:hypothetical protein [Planctomycetaceae bacterium]